MAQNGITRWALREIPRWCPFAATGSISNLIQLSQVSSFFLREVRIREGMMVTIIANLARERR
jgi:hypothetical protein